MEPSGRRPQGVRDPYDKAIPPKNKEENQAFGLSPSILPKNRLTGLFTYA